jgi:hypothetical protein
MILLLSNGAKPFWQVRRLLPCRAPSIEGDDKMRRQIVAALCAAVLGFAASSPLATAQQETQVAGSSNATGGVYSSIKDLMESIIDPSADALWGAVGTVVDKEGVHESLPRTPEEWLELRHAAVRIIEGSNLLMMPGREAAPAGTKSEAPGVELEPDQMTALINSNRESFNAFAKALQVLGLEALLASDAQNAALLMDVGAAIENACESCHQTFWYPPQKHTVP